MTAARAAIPRRSAVIPRRSSRARVAADARGRTDGEALAVAAWVRLLKAHNLVLRALRRRPPADLSLPQFDVLAQLARHRDGLKASELTRALLVTPGNVTGLVARLGRQGLVERLGVPGDRRAVRIRLTARGRRVVARALPRHRRQVAQLFAALPPGDLAALRALLGRLSHALEETA